jgi:hypothetical protein
MNKDDIRLMLEIIDMWLDQYRIYESTATKYVLMLRDKLRGLQHE